MQLAGINACFTLIQLQPIFFPKEQPTGSVYIFATKDRSQLFPLRGPSRHDLFYVLIAAARLALGSC